VIVAALLQPFACPCDAGVERSGLGPNPFSAVIVPEVSEGERLDGLDGRSVARVASSAFSTAKSRMSPSTAARTLSLPPPPAIASAACM
jgi:hypothetical protein